MSAIFPNAPVFSFSESYANPVCALIVPANIPERDCVRMCKALPPGMPDYLEMHIVRGKTAIEKSTAVIYGTRAYLIDFRIEL